MRRPAQNDRDAGPGSWSPWKEGPLVFVAGALAAAASFWPLPLHLTSRISTDLGDPTLQAWQVAWGGHALLTQPLHYFESNTFYPLRESLAFSDALIGYSPAGLVGHGVAAALLRYNLLFLFAYGLACAGAYLLARELGLPRRGALVGAAVFGFAPIRLAESSHLHILSSGGIPLTIFLLLRGYRRRSRGTIFVGWLVATWHVSLGFNLGLPFAYGLFVAVIAVSVAWFRGPRSRTDRRTVMTPTVAGVVVFVAFTALIARPYITVAHDHPEARRTEAQVKFFSPSAWSFAAAPDSSFVWSGATAGARERLPAAGFTPRLFPGAIAVLLALLGLARGPGSRRRRLTLGAAVLFLVSLSMGPRFANGWFGYRWLYELAPGWNGLRTPGRLNTFTSLGLAILAAGGATVLFNRFKGRAGAVLAGLAAIAIVVEGLGPPPIRKVPREPAGQAGVPGPLLNLPLLPINYDDYLDMLWSTNGFPQIMNGSSGFVPGSLAALPARVRGFPDPGSVAYLRSLGVRNVIFHPDLGVPPPSSARARALGVPAEQRGEVIVFHLLP